MLLLVEVLVGKQVLDRLLLNRQDRLLGRLQHMLLDLLVSIPLLLPLLVRLTPPCLSSLTVLHQKNHRKKPAILKQLLPLELFDLDPKLQDMNIGIGGIGIGQGMVKGNRCGCFTRVFRFIAIRSNTSYTKCLLLD